MQIILIAKPTANVSKQTTVKLTNLEAGNTANDYYMAGNANEVKTKGPEVKITPSPLIPDTPIAPYVPDLSMVGYIRMPGDTTLNAFKTAAAVKEAYADFKTYQVSYENKTSLNGNDYIPTGAIATNGKTGDLFRYVVFIMIGDINADGRITATDLSQVQALATSADILGDDPADNHFKFDTSSDPAKSSEDWGKKQTNNRRRALDIKWDCLFKSSDLTGSQLQLINYRIPDDSLSVSDGETKRCLPLVASYNI